MLCSFVDGRCSVCGVERQPPYPRRRCTPGLGDIVAVGLSAVGITEDRLAKATGGRDCGCARRRKWMNRVGRSLGIGPEPALTDTPSVAGSGYENKTVEPAR
jgi:hypothetical protein